MESVVVRMDPKEVSYFDPLTGCNFWLKSNIYKIPVNKDLRGIKRAVEAGTLQLLEGSFPEDASDIKPKFKK